MSSIDESAYRKRLERMSAIFTDIVARAERGGRSRCPYRDRRDRCSAKFCCRHQLPGGAASGDGANSADECTDTSVCAHDGRSDYRDAWEGGPRTAR